jgi:hypothetical protein
MTGFLLSALGIGKALLSWLSKRSLAEIACIILGLACLVLVIGNRAEKRHSAKLQAQVVSLNAELTKLSTAKNDQKVITAEKIKVVLQNNRDADGRARKIEQAPVPGGCKTKPEVLQADL